MHHTHYCIYIPLCFYFIGHRPHPGADNGAQFTFHYASTLSREMVCGDGCISIYIPLCCYFIEFGQWLEQEGLHLHSTMLLLYPGDWTRSWDRAPFTFHYASTLSVFWRPDRMYIYTIYIPLCFYFIKSLENGEINPRKNLHSTMLLLYRLPW